MNGAKRLRLSRLCRIMSVMVLMLALLCLATVAQEKSNWGEHEQVFAGSSGRHKFSIEIKCENFKTRGRRLSWVKVGELYQPAINGKRVWFTDGLDPKELLQYDLMHLLDGAIEVRSFHVIVDGKTWKVPEVATFDLLDLNLRKKPDPRDTSKAWLSADAARLVLKVGGSDGGGGYWAYFIFNKSGMIERRIYQENDIFEKLFFRAANQEA